MRADPDDRFTLDMIVPAAPLVEKPEAGKAKAKKATAKLASVKPGKVKLAEAKPANVESANVESANAKPAKAKSFKDSFLASWPRAPRRAGSSPRSNFSPPENEPPRPSDSAKINLAKIDPAEISAEAFERNRCARPTYEELWREPRRLAASISVAPAPKDRASGWGVAVAILMGVSALIALREKNRRRRAAGGQGLAAIGLPVNLAGLELRDLHSRIEMDGARKVLAVEGEIANMRRESRSVPPCADRARRRRASQIRLDHARREIAARTGRNDRLPRPSRRAAGKWRGRAGPLFQPGGSGGARAPVGRKFLRPRSYPQRMKRTGAACGSPRPGQSEMRRDPGVVACVEFIGVAERQLQPAQRRP